MNLFSKFTSGGIARSVSTLTLLTALAFPAYGQEAEPETGEATQQENGDSGFDMGQEVDESGNPIAEEPQEPQPGQQYLLEVHNDWALRCLKVEEGDDPCQMYQLLNDDAGNAVAEIAIVSLENGGEAVAGATIVVPLETLLTEQLTMRVDGGTARRFPYTFCNLGGCVARIGLRQEDLNLFRRGANATLRMVPAAAPDQEVVVSMSLSGFTAAYEAVSAQ